MESIITTTRRSAILPNNCMPNANLHTLCNDCLCSSTNERKLDYVEVFISTRALVILQGMAVYRVLDHFANSHGGAGLPVRQTGHPVLCHAADGLHHHPGRNGRALWG